MRKLTEQDLNEICDSFSDRMLMKADLVELALHILKMARINEDYVTAEASMKNLKFIAEWEYEKLERQEKDLPRLIGEDTNGNPVYEDSTGQWIEIKGYDEDGVFTVSDRVDL